MIPRAGTGSVQTATLTYTINSSSIAVTASAIRSLRRNGNLGSGLATQVAAMDSITVVLDNTDGAYTDVSFVNAPVSVSIVDGAGQALFGSYVVATSKPTGGIITQTLYDRMWLLEQPYTTALVLPATLAQIVAEIGLSHSITYPTSFNGSALTISKIPEGATERQMIAYIAQIGGYIAKFAQNGSLVFQSYNKSAFANPAQFASIFGLTSEEYDEPVTITGVQATIDDTTTLMGASGYVLAIDNPLLTADNVTEALGYLHATYTGMTLCACAVATEDNYTLELMDPIRITDSDGRTHDTYITSMQYDIQSSSAITCDVASTAKQSASGSTTVQRILSTADASTTKKLTSYDEVVTALTDTIAQGYGVYTTREAQVGGGYITYMHDASSMANSLVRWYMTSTGLIGQSRNTTTDEWTTSSALSATGQALCQVLNVIGINAEWIQAGTISGAITATDLTMTGGSIDIETDVDSNDLIRIVYMSDISTKLSEIRPGRFYASAYYRSEGTTEESYMVPSEVRTPNVYTGNASVTGTLSLLHPYVELTQTAVASVSSTAGYIQRHPTGSVAYHYRFTLSTNVTIASRASYNLATLDDLTDRPKGTQHVLSVFASAYTNGIVALVNTAGNILIYNTTASAITIPAGTNIYITGGWESNNY